MKPILVDFIQEILAANQIPFHLVTIPCDDWDWFDLGLRSTLLGDHSLKRLNGWCESHAGSFLYCCTDEFQCNHAILNLPDSSEWLFVGPILFEEIKGRRFDELFQSLELPERVRIPLLNHYYNIKLVTWRTVFENFMGLLGDHVFGKEQYQIVYRYANEWRDWCKNYQKDEVSSGIPENPFLNIRYLEERYEAENALIRAVSAGNEAQALTHINMMQSMMMPQRSESKLRDVKNYMITLNTLLRKACENSGVHPYHIDKYSNQNVQQLEQMTGADQSPSLQRKIIRGYCQLVKEFNLKDYSMPIRKAITYINADLSADLSLKFLASQLNVNASYLSTLFKKETGTTLTEYVSSRRILHAQKLLRGTDLPIQAISLQCGIEDMYYFSRMFKRIAGVTPRGYRERMSFPAQD